MFRAVSQRQPEIDERNRQDEYAEDDQRTEEKLRPRSGIFERLAIDAYAIPDVLAHIGLSPKAVERQRQYKEQGVDKRDATEAGLGLISD